MVVARSRHLRERDDEGYAISGECQKVIWARYKEILAGESKSSCKAVLEHCDNSHHWTLLMHSAKGGNENNFKVVLGWYKELFGDDWSQVQRMIDWTDVDRKLKDFVNKEAFDGEYQSISNYGKRQRRSVRKSATSTRASSNHKSAPPNAKGRKAVAAKKSTPPSAAHSKVKEEDEDDQQAIGDASRQKRVKVEQEDNRQALDVAARKKRAKVKQETRQKSAKVEQDDDNVQQARGVAARKRHAKVKEEPRPDDDEPSDVINLVGSASSDDEQEDRKPAAVPRRNMKDRLVQLEQAIGLADSSERNTICSRLEYLEEACWDAGIQQGSLEGRVTRLGRSIFVVAVYAVRTTSIIIATTTSSIDESELLYTY